MRCIAIACLGLFGFAGCAFDESEELSADAEIASAEGVADQETAPAEEELAALEAEEELAAFEAEEADAEVTSEPTEEQLGPVSPRYHIGDGNCHSFDYLRYWSNWYCQAVWSGSSRATSRDYQIGCSRSWGNGAKYVSFVCVGG